MYCVKCGVELAETETRCPLCLTKVCCPEEGKPEERPVFPQERFPGTDRAHWEMAIFFTALWGLGLIFSVLCDLQRNHQLTWSVYVIGGLFTAYTAFVLPGWFRRPNPVIFVPCAIAAAVGYLLLIELLTGGGWFLPFAFPVAGGLGLLVTAHVTLLKYIRGGRLFISGGALLLYGLFMPLLELLLHLTFPAVAFSGWSFYPMTGLMLLGGFLIFLGICRPARQAMERKFFF